MQPEAKAKAELGQGCLRPRKRPEIFVLELSSGSMPDIKDSVHGDLEHLRFRVKG